MNWISELTKSVSAVVYVCVCVCGVYVVRVPGVCVVFM